MFSRLFPNPNERHDALILPRGGPRPGKGALIDEGTVLVLSSRHRLWQRYGADGVFAVERAVGELLEAMSQRGLMGMLVYADDSPLLTRLGILPANTGQPESVARLVRALCGRMAYMEASPKYVLILGDEGIVPFGRLANPSPDDEAAVSTDEIYGQQVDGWPASQAPFNSTRAVGRIPDGCGALEMFISSIRMAAVAHRRLAAGAKPRLAAEAWGYSASVWRRAARGAFAAVGEPRSLRLSPPLTHVEAPQPGAGGPRFRYYNLHGLVDSPNWFGQTDPSFPADYPTFPVALRPEDMAAAPGSVLFSAACFGAHLGQRRVHESVALTALAGGALAFVGATGVAYGGLDGPLVAADLLAFRFWEAVLQGAPAGQALRQAKQKLTAEALRRQGYIDAEDEKTALNFVLYGDPSLVHHLPSVWTEDGWMASPAAEVVEPAGPAVLVGTLPVRPHSTTDGPSRKRRSGSELAEHVRTAVARRLPHFATGEAEVALAPALSGHSQAKGAGDAAPGALNQGAVVTFTKSLPTCDGPTCHEVLRVTVDGDGRIRKMILSR